LLGAGLVGLGLVGGTPPGWPGLARRAALVTALLVQFRVWDDLADRERDRRRHADRALPAASRLGPFHALWGAAAGASAALLAAGPAAGTRLAGYGLLGLGLALWYARGARRWTWPVLGYHVVLAKYPVFVYLLGGDVMRPAPRLLAMLASYLALCVYEVLHDPETARAAGARCALRVEAGALVSVATLLAVSLA
jgi:4-hydroxybenzoate polyprenyltransferase